MNIQRAIGLCGLTCAILLILGSLRADPSAPDPRIIYLPTPALPLAAPAYAAEGHDPIANLAPALAEPTMTPAAPAELLPPEQPPIAAEQLPAEPPAAPAEQPQIDTPAIEPPAAPEQAPEYTPEFLAAQKAAAEVYAYANLPTAGPMPVIEPHGPITERDMRQSRQRTR